MKYYDMTKQELIDEIYKLNTRLEERENAEKYANVMICYSNLKGVIIKIPKNIASILGYTEKEIIGKRVFEFIHPEDLKESKIKFNQLINGQLDAIEMEKRYKKQDGSYLWMYVNCVLVKNNEGKPLHVIAYMQNITEKKEFENKLMQSYENYKNLFQFLPEAIFITCKGMCNFINKEAVKLLEIEDPEEIAGMNLLDLIHLQCPKFKEYAEKKLYIDKEIIPFFEQKIIKPNGSIIYMEVGFFPIEFNRKDMILTVARDISSTKRHAKQLNEINKQLKMYINENEKLIFDLRRFRHNSLNILYGLGGYIESNDIEGVRSYFKEIEEQVELLKDSNIFFIEKVKNPAVRALLNVKLTRARELNINFRIQIDDNIKIKNNFITEVDLCEVLGIYLDNAIEAAEKADNKKVSVYIMEDNEVISLIIENTFKEKPDLNTIYQGYSTKGKHRGLGLKLSNKILGKYENVLHNTFIQHNTFVQEIFVIKSKTK
ncbi:PAS domain S-box protein [Clostridium sp. JNZ J1-5]